jgi:hypothetical protein
MYNRKAERNRKSVRLIVIYSAIFVLVMLIWPSSKGVKDDDKLEDASAEQKIMLERFEATEIDINDPLSPNNNDEFNFAYEEPGNGIEKTQKGEDSYVDSLEPTEEPVINVEAIQSLDDVEIQENLDRIQKLLNKNGDAMSNEKKTPVNYFYENSKPAEASVSKETDQESGQQDVVGEKSTELQTKPKNIHNWSSEEESEQLGGDTEQQNGQVASPVESKQQNDQPVLDTEQHIPADLNEHQPNDEIKSEQEGDEKKIEQQGSVIPNAKRIAQMYKKNALLKGKTEPQGAAEIEQKEKL